MPVRLTFEPYQVLKLPDRPDLPYVGHFYIRLAVRLAEREKASFLPDRLPVLQA